MNVKNCIIVGAGALHFKRPLPDADLIIAADGGYACLPAMGLCADIVVGDWDSLGVPPDHHNVITLPKNKDESDMMAAIKYGLAKGCAVFHLYGGTGGRFDHTLANVQCLAYLAYRDARGFLYDETSVTTVIRNGSITFGAGHTGTVSVFALSDTAAGVSIGGLQYELTDATLTNANPLGLSNAFVGQPARVSARDGMLAIVYSIP
jgi:thiamine pyrophosphokinase